ncbi:MAG: hypothetical protein J1F09_00570 [Oscillospiraceae bacterium]|nr:hypothetical protein [Oscillospiraceae bacterium]
MTVGEMRKLMMKKVVPENVIPQNIIDFLMDENAELPEPDAFTFLTRLRTLGIGSADFLYLMEGCHAPQSAVDKIRANPAMNLQSLILTLEGSGMTSQDYTRILYTARQIWERTLTMRLENSEKISDGDYPDEEAPEEEYEEYDEPSFEEVMEETIAEDSGYDGDGGYEELPDDEFPDYDESSEDISNKEDDFEFEYIPDSDYEEESEPEPETFPENEEYSEEPDHTFGEEEARETEPYEEPSEEYESAEELDDNEYEPRSDSDIPLSKRKHFTVEISYDDESPAPEEPEEMVGKVIAPRPYNGDTTAIVQINRDILEENLARLAEETESEEEEEPEDADNSPVGFYGDSDDDTDDEDDEFDADDDGEKPVYHKGRLIASAVGAAVLVGASAASGFFFDFFANRRVRYAEDENTIFSAIYYAYDEKIPGGELACEYVPDLDTVFGNLLIHRDGFGVFSEGNSVYNVGSLSISANSFANGTVQSIGELTPPKNTEIVAAFEQDDALIAFFSGESSDSCGYMKIRGGETLYTVRQDGALTDLSIDGSEIRIGSVYTPKFYENFKVENVGVYLPKLGKDEPLPISAQDVIISKTKGYSYAVSAAYSSESGETLSAKAALGDPVFASANGIFALNGEEDEGLLIKAGENLTTQYCGKITAAAFFENGGAVCENGEIYLRDSDLKECSRLVSLTDKPAFMRFSGNNLLVSDTTQVFLSADCTNMEEPITMGLIRADGICDSEYALVVGKSENSAEITLLKLENGTADPVYAYSKPLTAAQLSTLSFGGAKAMISDGELCGAAYSYFDGVSVVSEFASLGALQKVTTLYDDKTGFTFAFASGGKMYAVCASGAADVSNNS